jgi:hypothetical protein
MIYNEKLRRPEWLAFRESVLDQRGAKCEYCEDDRDLCVHHLRYRYGAEPWEYSITHDVIVLCRECHWLCHFGNRDVGPEGQWIMRQFSPLIPKGVRPLIRIFSFRQTWNGAQCPAGIRLEWKPSYVVWMLGNRRAWGEFVDGVRRFDLAPVSFLTEKDRTVVNNVYDIDYSRVPGGLRYPPKGPKFKRDLNYTPDFKPETSESSSEYDPSRVLAHSSVIPEP